MCYDLNTMPLIKARLNPSTRVWLGLRNISEKWFNRKQVKKATMTITTSQTMTITTSQVLGWTSTIVWSLSFYPQVIFRYNPNQHNPNPNQLNPNPNPNPNPNTLINNTLITYSMSLNTLINNTLITYSMSLN